MDYYQFLASEGLTEPLQTMSVVPLGSVMLSTLHLDKDDCCVADKVKLIFILDCSGSMKKQLPTVLPVCRQVYSDTHVTLIAFGSEANIVYQGLGKDIPYIPGTGGTFIMGVFPLVYSILDSDPNQKYHITILSDGLLNDIKQCKNTQLECRDNVVGVTQFAYYNIDWGEPSPDALAKIAGFYNGPSSKIDLYSNQPKTLLEKIQQGVLDLPNVLHISGSLLLYGEERKTANIAVGSPFLIETGTNVFVDGKKVPTTVETNPLQVIVDYLTNLLSFVSNSIVAGKQMQRDSLRNIIAYIESFVASYGQQYVDSKTMTSRNRLERARRQASNSNEKTIRGLIPTIRERLNMHGVIDLTVKGQLDFLNTSAAKGMAKRAKDPSSINMHELVDDAKKISLEVRTIHPMEPSHITLDTQVDCIKALKSVRPGDRFETVASAIGFVGYACKVSQGPIADGFTNIYIQKIYPPSVTMTTAELVDSTGFLRGKNGILRVPASSSPEDSINGIIIIYPSKESMYAYIHLGNIQITKMFTGALVEVPQITVALWCNAVGNILQQEPTKWRVVMFQNIMQQIQWWQEVFNCSLVRDFDSNPLNTLNGDNHVSHPYQAIVAYLLGGPSIGNRHLQAILAHTAYVDAKKQSKYQSLDRTGVEKKMVELLGPIPEIPTEAVEAEPGSELQFVLDDGKSALSDIKPQIPEELPVSEEDVKTPELFQVIMQLPHIRENLFRDVDNLLSILKRPRQLHPIISRAYLLQALSFVFHARRHTKNALGNIVVHEKIFSKLSAAIKYIQREIKKAMLVEWKAAMDAIRRQAVLAAQQSLVNELTTIDDQKTFQSYIRFIPSHSHRLPTLVEQAIIANEDGMRLHWLIISPTADDEIRRVAKTEDRLRLWQILLGPLWDSLEEDHVVKVHHLYRSCDTPNRHGNCNSDPSWFATGELEDCCQAHSVPWLDVCPFCQKNLLERRERRNNNNNN